MGNSKKQDEKQQDQRAGHRARMFDKYDQKGSHSLTDQELFEMLLFAVQSRIDTKPAVKGAFKEYKSLAPIFSASQKELQKIKGIGPETARYLKLIHCLFDRLSFEAITTKDVISNWRDLEYFCVQKLSHHQVEAFLMIMLDNQNKVINFVTLGEGTINQMVIYPREVLRKALEYNAVSVIIVHNHPSGDPRPSREDITLTNSLKKSLATAGIHLLDHLIIAGSQCISLKNQGLIDP